MHKIALFCLGFASLLLVGCVTKEASNERAACYATCQQQLTQCTNVCEDRCCQCQNASCKQTSTGYKKYRKQQIVQGKIIARDLNSYHDPLQCRKTTCNCQADYNVCIQSCRGVIHKKLEVPRVCC